MSFVLSKLADQNTDIFLSECRHLPESDRKYMVKARQIAGILDEEEDTEVSDSDNEELTPVAFRVQVRQSPYIDMFHNHQHSESPLIVEQLVT